MTDDEGPGIFVPPPLMFGVATAVGALIDGNELDWKHVAHPSQLVGVVVAGGGIVLIAICLGLFRRFRTRPEPWEPDQALIRSGVYRFTRNPMYLGMALLCAGVAIFFESLPAFFLLAVTLVVIDRYVIEREEAYLARRFGAEYDEYRTQVRRWL